jgi:hypothetical protein
MTPAAANDDACFGLPLRHVETVMFAYAARARLACFPHAYSLAVRLRERTGVKQFVIRTACPLQPVRVSASPPVRGEVLMALVA